MLVTLCQTATDPMPDAPSYSDYAEYDTGQAAAHLTIQARAFGMEAHTFAGFDHEAVTQTFGIPSNFKVMTGIAIGRPGDHAEIAAASERDQERERRSGSAALSGCSEGGSPRRNGPSDRRVGGHFVSDYQTGTAFYARDRYLRNAEVTCR